jgi:phosphoribosylglycinamide formyltransferase-1
MTKDIVRIAVLVSGGGTNLQAVIDGIENGMIRNVEIVRVISSNPEAYSLERARKERAEVLKAIDAGAPVEPGRLKVRIRTRWRRRKAS